MKNEIKYDCPIKFAITNCRAGWTKLSAEINGNKIDFTITSIWQGVKPSLLLESAYFFNPYLGFFQERVDIEYEVCNDAYEDITDIPLQVQFQWDDELNITQWVIEMPREQFEKPYPELIINIIRENSCEEQKKTYSFRVKYKDFCYAVAKCFSDCLKGYGMDGYYRRSYNDEINLRYLIFVKAYGMGMIANDLSVINSLDYNYDFTFEEEMKILAMDM